MESYVSLMEDLAQTPDYDRREAVYGIIRDMHRASERDIIAARWMAGGALLTSDESLLDRGVAPDPDTFRSVREALTEYARVAANDAPEDEQFNAATAHETLVTAKDKLKARLRKFRTFTPITEQAFAETLELLVRHGEEGLAGDIARRVSRRGWGRQAVVRYLRRSPDTVGPFATCAGKLYAGHMRLRALHTSNRRSNDLHVYQTEAAETLLKQLALRTPPGFWSRFPAAREGLAALSEMVIDITGMHTTLLHHNIEAFTEDVRTQVEANVMDWAHNDGIPTREPGPGEDTHMADADDEEDGGGQAGAGESTGSMPTLLSPDERSAMSRDANKLFAEEERLERAAAAARIKKEDKEFKLELARRKLDILEAGTSDEVRVRRINEYKARHTALIAKVGALQLEMDALPRTRKNVIRRIRLKAQKDSNEAMAVYVETTLHQWEGLPPNRPATDAALQSARSTIATLQRDVEKLAATYEELLEKITALQNRAAPLRKKLEDDEKNRLRYEIGLRRARLDALENPVQVSKRARPAEAPGGLPPNSTVYRVPQQDCVIHRLPGITAPPLVPVADTTAAPAADTTPATDTTAAPAADTTTAPAPADTTPAPAPTTLPPATPTEPDSVYRHADAGCSVYRRPSNATSESGGSGALQEIRKRSTAFGRAMFQRD